MRPRIICHMVSSIDGRLLVNRWTPPAAGIDAAIVLRLYDQIAARFPADGWIVGRKTMESYAKSKPQSSNRAVEGLRDTHIADRRNRRLAVAIDPQGKLHYGQDDADGYHIVAVLGEQVSDGYLAELRADGISYLFAGADGHDLNRAMDTLGDAFCAKTVLLEGGGRINGAFLKAGLIDEISLLVCPAIDGLAGIPSIFEYAGGADERPAAGRSLRHVATETLEGGMVWLRYNFETSRAPA
jgi:riboflavin biosynthesis pyrimidine reductase